MSSNNAHSGILNMKNMTASLLLSKSQAKKKVSCGSLPPKSKAIREGNSGRYTFFFKNFLKLEQLIYNVVLVSGVQQCESVYTYIYIHTDIYIFICVYTHTHTHTHTHIYPLSLDSFFSHICHYSESESHSVMSDSFRPHGLYSLKFSRPEYWSA